MSKSVPIIMTLLLLLVGAPVVWYFLNGNSFGDIRSKAAPATNLKLATTPGAIAVGQQISVQVIAESNENNIGAIQPVLKFDPAYLKVLSIAPGTFLTNPGTANERLDNTAGVASVYLYATKTNKGTGTVMNVSFETKKAGSTTVRFDTTSTANASGEVQAGTSTAQNVIIGMAPLTITIGGGAQAASTTAPTSAPTVVPTVAPTHVTTPSPTINPTATPKTTITPEPTAEPELATSASTFKVTIPTEGENFTTSSPTFTGIGAIGSSVTLVLYGSETTTNIASTSSTGLWEFTPETPLADGQYTLSATYAALDGTTDVITRQFTVTVTAPPVTGNELPIIMLLAAVSLLVSGGVYILRFSRT
jgi:hypothetical protein